MSTITTTKIYTRAIDDTYEGVRTIQRDINNKKITNQAALDSMCELMKNTLRIMATIVASNDHEK